MFFRICQCVIGYLITSPPDRLADLFRVCQFMNELLNSNLTCQDLAVREQPPDLLFDLFRIWHSVNGHLTFGFVSRSDSAWTATWPPLWLVQDLAVRERPPDLLFDFFRIWQCVNDHLTSSLTCSGSGSAWTTTWPPLWLVQDLAVRERPPNVSQLPATNRRLSALPLTVQQYKGKGFQINCSNS